MTAGCGDNLSMNNILEPIKILFYQMLFLVTPNIGKAEKLTGTKINDQGGSLMLL